MAGRAGSPGRSVTSRALAVLSTFTSATPRLGLSEIADRAGLPLTTAHRLLGELRHLLRLVPALEVAARAIGREVQRVADPH